MFHFYWWYYPLFAEFLSFLLSPICFFYTNYFIFNVFQEHYILNIFSLSIIDNFCITNQFNGAFLWLIWIILFGPILLLFLSFIIFSFLFFCVSSLIKIIVNFHLLGNLWNSFCIKFTCLGKKWSWKFISVLHWKTFIIIIMFIQILNKLTKIAYGCFGTFH